MTKWKKSAWRYYRFTHVYYKWRSYDTWFLKYFLVNFGYFLPVQHPPPPFPPLPLMTRIIKILKNWKKTTGGIIILHMCAINNNQMMYGSSLNVTWSMTDRIFCHFGRLTDIIFIFHFGLFFALLPLLTTQKDKIKKKKRKEIKKPLQILSFYTCAP